MILSYAECEESLGAPKAGLSPELDALAEYLEGLPNPLAPNEWESDGGVLLESLLVTYCHPTLLCTRTQP